jgi:hypothetical protein
MLIVQKWRKWLPMEPTSAWWYTSSDFKRLIFSHIAEVRRGGANRVTTLFTLVRN